MYNLTVEKAGFRSSMDHDTLVCRLALREEELRGKGKLHARMETEMNCEFPNDLFRNTMYQEALLMQTKALDAIKKRKLVEARQFAASAVAEYELVECDYRVRRLDGDEESRVRFPCYMQCAKLLLSMIDLRELAYAQTQLAEMASGQHDDRGADYHARMAISHSYAYEKTKDQLENKINRFLWATTRFVVTDKQTMSFMHVDDDMFSWEYRNALKKRLDLFSYTKKARYRKKLLKRQQILKDEYETRTRTKRKSMHVFIEEFSTARSSEQTQARLLLQSAYTNYHRAILAFVAGDLNMAKQCLLVAIKDYKLNVFTNWENERPFETQDEYLQCAKRCLRMINVYLAGKTQEDAAKNALVAGDHGTAISCATAAIFYYEKYQEMTIQFDIDVTWHKKKLLGSSQSQQETDKINADFAKINNKELDSVRTTEFLKSVRSEMWLRGATELRMLLHRDKIVPLTGTLPLHKFVKEAANVRMHAADFD